LTSGEQDDLQSFLETLQQSLEALNQDSGKYRVVVQTVWRSWSNQMIQLQGFLGQVFVTEHSFVDIAKTLGQKSFAGLCSMGIKRTTGAELAISPCD